MEKQRKKRETYAVDEATIAANAAGTPRYAFAMTLNKIMLEKGVDQIVLANDLGYSTGMVSKYRKGESEPSLSRLVEIARYFGVDCHYLMTGASSENYRVNDVTGLNDDNISWLRDANNGEESRGGEYIAFINELFSSGSFRLLVSELFELSVASEAAKLYENAQNAANFVALDGRNEFELTEEECEKLYAEYKAAFEDEYISLMNSGVRPVVREILNEMYRASNAQTHGNYLPPDSVSRYYAREHFDDLLDVASGKKKLRKAPQIIDGKLVL